jgi:glycosyltransferase involved in cell wall biosynthesis
LKDILTDGENSFIIEKKNVQEIVDTLEKIDKNPESYRSFCDKNYNNILENFTENIFSNKLYSIINEL